LPAPLGPMSPTSSPWQIWMLKSCTAFSPPKVMPSFFVSRIGVFVSAMVGHLLFGSLGGTGVREMGPDPGRPPGDVAQGELPAAHDALGPEQDDDDQGDGVHQHGIGEHVLDN